MLTGPPEGAFLGGPDARGSPRRPTREERTIAWLAGCRRPRVCHERDSKRFFASAMLACDRLCENPLPRAATPGYHDPGFGSGVPAADDDVGRRALIMCSSHEPLG
jgi:hypothetical protein